MFNYSIDKHTEQKIIDLEKNFVTFKDAAKILGCEVSYLYRIKDKQPIVYTTLFGLYVMPITELKRLLDKKNHRLAELEKKKQATIKRQKESNSQIKKKMIDLKQEARSLQLKVASLSKSELVRRINEVKQLQLNNPAIGKKLSHLIEHSYLYSISELTEALQNFSKTELNTALLHSNLTNSPIPSYLTKENFIKAILDIIGAGYA